jgi:hypothetical protein
MRLRRRYLQFPSYDIKILLVGRNAKVGKEIWTGIAVSTCDLNDEGVMIMEILILVMYNHHEKSKFFFELRRVSCPEIVFTLRRRLGMMSLVYSFPGS